ncbi:hypothetical protein [Saccharothrix violaceirubra]|uniref:Uncharacterized protein n=1 Tax=Saccharothrix violaceirubra TaxID=413306 RepID=A0A7W7WXT7_9PSEU|nr:hypothetical protein [Saccharothrix violaceirubra]MBB4967789.1 hypothetical protein [Saccharothrix violaceirubra]
MKEHRRELVRLCRVAIDRPRPQLVVAVLVSTWSLGWVVGQVRSHPSPLDVLAAPLEWAAVPTGWLAAVDAWLTGRTAFLAVAGGLLWAMTTPRRQGGAVLGWIAVMLAAESVGYGAVHRALLTLAVFLFVLVVLSVPGRRAFVVDRIALIPGDVLRAAATALALAAVVPLLAPGLLVAALLGPYVTRPPRARVVEVNGRSRNGVVPAGETRPVPVPRSAE